MSQFKYIAAVLFLVVANGCSMMQSTVREPQFYPNDKLQKTNRGQVHEDTRYCMSLADDYVKDPDAFKEGAKNTAKTAAVGAAGGAVAGAIMGGGVGRYVASGAAVAAIFQILKEADKAGEKSPGWEKFVEQCLANKGYQVYSWE